MLAELSRVSGLVLLVAAPTMGFAAGELDFTRLVGTGDRLWPEPVGLLGHAGVPHAGGDYVVFSASAPDGMGDSILGVWLWDGSTYEPVVDTTMPEGQSPSFDTLGYSVDETGLVAVNVPEYAMLGWQDGSLFPIVLVGDEPPGSSGGTPFYGFSDPIVGEGTIYFGAGIENVPVEDRFRLYSWSAENGLTQLDIGELQAPSVPVPGHGGSYFRAHDADLGWVIWFRSDDGTLMPYMQADTTPFPGGPPGSTWRFYFDQPGVLDEGLVIGGLDDTLSVGGLYRHTADGFETVILRGDPDPVSGVPNNGFAPSYAAEGDRIAFTTVWGTGHLTLIVQQPDRTLAPIVATEGLGIDGEPVGHFTQTYSALAGDRLVFGALQATDRAVWMVDLAGDPPPPPPDIPTLGTLALVALGLALGTLGLATIHRGRGTLRG